MRKWTAQENALVIGDTPPAELAEKLGVSVAAIHNQRRNLRRKNAELIGQGLPPINWAFRAESELRASGFNPDGTMALVDPTPLKVDCSLPDGGEVVLPPAEPATPPAPDFDKDREAASDEFWRTQHDSVKREYEKALKHLVVVDRLCDLVGSLAPRSYDPAPPVPPSEIREEGNPQSAVLMFSDTHVGQDIRPDQTLGFGGYDIDVFLDRLARLEGSVERILRNHVNTEVPELHIAIMGDMMHGALNHSSEADQLTTLFDQFFIAGHAIGQFVRNLARLVPRVRLHCTVGNHTRWGNQKKMPTGNRYSNLDQFLYTYCAALTGNIENVHWVIDRQPFAVWDTQNFLFFQSHGDHLRGGDRALGIPNHAVGRMVSQTTQLFDKAEIKSPDYYLVGHMHRRIELPTARGDVIINGGFPGLDNYALASHFNPVDPTQKFFLVHPVYGRTASYDIALKFAKPGAGRERYSIPTP